MFKRKAKYTRDQIAKIIRPEDPPRGGDWTTGYARIDSNLFVFMNIGLPGRTGHDFENHYDEKENKILWFSKPNKHSSNPLFQKILSGELTIYFFARWDNNPPFTFLGTGNVDNFEDRHITPQGHHCIKMYVSITQESQMDASHRDNKPPSEDIDFNRISSREENPNPRKIKFVLLKAASVISGVDSFVGVTKFSNLIDNYETPIYKPGIGDMNNYQREPTPSRIEQIAQRFIEKDTIIREVALIDNINLNIRTTSPSHFYEKLLTPLHADKTGVGQVYTFEYTPELGKFYIVDGQTRVRGLDKAIKILEIQDPGRALSLRETTINFALTFTKDTSDEAFIFYLLNKYSKPLDTSGVRRILYHGWKNNNEKFLEEIVISKIDKDIDIMEACDRINEDTNSLWFDSVTDYNEGKKIIDQKSMVDLVLKPIFKLFDDLEKKNSNIHTRGRERVEVVLSWVNSYWKAVSMVYPGCFGKFRNKYNIQKASSANILTTLMVEMIKMKFSRQFLSEDSFDLESIADWQARLEPILLNMREKNSNGKFVKGHRNWLVGKDGSMGSIGNNSARKDFAMKLLNKHREKLINNFSNNS